MLRITTLVLAVVLLSPTLLQAADLHGLVISETAIIEDNYGYINLDDVDARDELRDEIGKRNVLFANNFVRYLKTGQWRENLKKLVNPADVASIPNNLVSWLENDVEEINFDGTWDDEDQERLDKIRSAMAIKGLLDFGIPGKSMPHEIPGEASGDAIEGFLIGSSGGADPAFLQKIREYEDNYQKMWVIKVEGSDGRADAPAIDIEGAIIGMMNQAISGVKNPPSQGDVDSFVESVSGLFADPTDGGWKINSGWWNLTHAGGSLASTANQYNMVSGAQLLGIKMKDINPATATADELIEALSTASKYSIEYSGKIYSGATNVSGTWSSGSSMAYSMGALDTSTNPADVIRVLETVSVKEEPLNILAANHSEEVSGLSSEIPEFPVSEELLLLIKLVQAFQEPATEVPASEGSFTGPSSGGNAGGVTTTFGGGGGLGSSF